MGELVWASCLSTNLLQRLLRTWRMSIKGQTNSPTARPVRNALVVGSSGQSKQWWKFSKEGSTPEAKSLSRVRASELTNPDALPTTRGLFIQWGTRTPKNCRPLQSKTSGHIYILVYWAFFAAKCWRHLKSFNFFSPNTTGFWWQLF